eukprot:928241-Rhodomonas_salina.3
MEHKRRPAKNFVREYEEEVRCPPPPPPPDPSRSHLALSVFRRVRSGAARATVHPGAVGEP